MAFIWRLNIGTDLLGSDTMIGDKEKTIVLHSIMDLLDQPLTAFVCLGFGQIDCVEISPVHLIED